MVPRRSPKRKRRLTALSSPGLLKREAYQSHPHTSPAGSLRSNPSAHPLGGPSLAVSQRSPLPQPRPARRVHRPCLARGVTDPRPQPWPGRPASTPAWPAPKDAAEGAEETIATPHLRRRPQAARDAAERGGALQAMRRSLRPGPARRLPAIGCGFLAQEPAQGSTSNASGVRSSPTVNRGALSGPEGANSSAPLTASEGLAPRPMLFKPGLARKRRWTRRRAPCSMHAPQGA